MPTHMEVEDLTYYSTIRTSTLALSTGVLVSLSTSLSLAQARGCCKAQMGASSSRAEPKEGADPQPRAQLRHFNKIRFIEMEKHPQKGFS